jgi:hypothetical protein
MSNINLFESDGLQCIISQPQPYEDAMASHPK